MSPPRRYNSTGAESFLSIEATGMVRTGEGGEMISSDELCFESVWTWMCPRGVPAAQLRREVVGSAGLRRLRAQQSLDSSVYVPARGNEGLQVGLTVDEAHGAQLLQLLLESHLRVLYLGVGAG